MGPRTISLASSSLDVTMTTPIFWYLVLMQYIFFCPFNCLFNYTSVHVCANACRCTWKPEMFLWSPAIVTGSCEPPGNGSWELNVGLALLTMSYLSSIYLFCLELIFICHFIFSPHILNFMQSKNIYFLIWQHVPFGNNNIDSTVFIAPVIIFHLSC